MHIALYAIRGKQSAAKTLGTKAVLISESSPQNAAASERIKMRIASSITGYLLLGRLVKVAMFGPSGNVNGKKMRKMSINARQPSATAQNVAIKQVSALAVLYESGLVRAIMGRKKLFFLSAQKLVA